VAEWPLLLLLRRRRRRQNLLLRLRHCLRRWRLDARARFSSADKQKPMSNFAYET
jgi:hypothetical protein